MPYTVPTSADLKMRFPAFASTPDATVEYWITDAQRIVTTDWSEGDYQPAIMALAAHEMALLGIGSEGDAAASAASAGVTRFKSGAVDLQFSEAAANAAVAGGYGATRYGLAFQAMLRRNLGGPFVVGATHVPGCCL